MNFLLFLFIKFYFETNLLSANDSDKCEKILYSSIHQKEGTDDLIAILARLLEQHLIAEQELLAIAEGANKGLLLNPIDEDKAMTSSVHYIYREKIQEHIETTKIDLQKLFVWVKKYLNEKEHVRIELEKTFIETKDLHQKIELYTVPSGSFLMGEDLCKVRVVLSYPFDAMSTLVTQKHWVDVLGQNPAYFANGNDAIEVDTHAGKIQMQPDHPVENISWWSALVFANKLSEMHGLRPAYDFRGIKFIDKTLLKTTPQDNDRKVLSSWAEIMSVASKGNLGVLGIKVIPKINAPNGNIYQAQGYRLPTEAEQEYLLRAAGKSNGMYFFGNNVGMLKDVAWFAANSNFMTQPVASLKPLIINDLDLNPREFFDLHGNVAEWGYDWFSNEIKGGENPIGESFGSSHVARSGHYNDSARILRSACRYNPGILYKDKTIGFRLVKSHSSQSK